MKKSFNKLVDKKIKNPKAIKGGGFGKGTKKSTASTSARAELQ